MNSIAAMELEIRYQLQDLPKLIRPNNINPDYCLFIGSGDSFVAGLIAHYASGGRAITCKPVEFLLNPSIANKRQIYIISISGRTNANILSAKTARKQKIRTTAITRKPESILAKYCDDIIKLSYKSTDVLTSGTIGFTSCMLTCLSLISDVKEINYIDKVYFQAKIEADDMLEKHSMDTSSFIFLGDGLLFPVGIYGALKMNEIFGSRSYAYMIDEFCHSPIFSIRREDNIIIFDKGDYDKKKAQVLCKRLDKISYSSLYIDLKKLTGIEAVLKSIFLIQFLMLKLAKRNRLKECFFICNKELLKLSSDLIYK
ncbi:MAG TPA: hypothetical protein VFY64_05210 [Nitrososphaeraceae archaeon]|nr:hypothetical protein [Nitrososphaeraceae archaeon]